MKILVRLDLDRYDLEMIERLVIDGVISPLEAMESKAVKDLGDWQGVMWIRNTIRYESVG